MIENLDNNPVVVSLRKKIQEQQVEISHLLLDIGQNKEFHHELIKNIKKIKPYPNFVIPRPRKVKAGSPVVAVLQFGDWHIGENIESNIVNEFNAYNYQKASDRVFNITSGFNSWVNVHRYGYFINDCVILDIGDNISGDIHHELTITNEFPVPEQIIRCCILKAEAYRRIAQNFKKVEVHFIVPDNHSRKTRKYQYKQGGLNSENYLVGYITKLMLREIEKIDFKLILSHQGEVMINGFLYLCEHGKDIKSWSGIPYYGMDRKVGREAKRRMANRGFYKMVLQHFHVPAVLPHCLIGGSLSGTNELDHALGREALPCQCGFLVHPKYGDFNWTRFWGDKK